MDKSAEVELLNAILVGGYDQGCFLRPGDAALLPLAPAVTTAVMTAMAERDIKAEPTADDPFEGTRLLTGEIVGDGPGFVVLTQRCDLVRGLMLEPFVELAHVERTANEDLISQAKRNSPRFIHLADCPDATAWVADLRQRAVLAKDHLAELPSVQPLVDEVAYRRFKLRVGQRYSRDALPTRLVRDVQRPLQQFFRKPANMGLAAVFTEFLVFEKDGQAQVVPIIGPGEDRHQAEDAWADIESRLPADLVTHMHDASNPLPIEDVNFWRYLTGWKLDLDEVTYHRKAGDQQSPTV
jgi:hypothetical protein